MITVDNLQKRYGDLVAVDGISFEIASGEAFGLLGPNGAGKTTTINMLVGILAPDGGSINIDGASDPTRPEVRRRIGNAPQTLALYDDLTASENLVFIGRLYGLRGARLTERVDYALDLAGLTNRRDDRVETFSGGMKRRLNLVCALIHDPPTLLLDEPTVGVDPQSRNLIFDQIEQLRGEGKTIVFTTHYMEEAERLCDRVAIMDHGTILALDTVEALIAEHGGRSVIEGELESPPEAGTQAEFAGQIDGTHFRMETDRPFEDISRLSGAGLRFRSLRVDQADLESVFLNLTGRRLRD